MERRGRRRKSDDYSGNYATPIWTVRAVLPHLPMVKRILDPCAGTGNILKAVSEYYGDRDKPDVLAGIETSLKRVRRVVLIDRVTDCLHADALSPAVEWNNPELIILHPPMATAEAFVRRALQAVAPGGTVAALLRLAFMAGITRRFFWSGKVTDVAVLARFVRFGKIGTVTRDSDDHAWYIFGPQATGKWFRLEAAEPKMTRSRRLDTALEEPDPPIITI